MDESGPNTFHLCAETVLRHILILINNNFQCRTTNEIANELFQLFLAKSLKLKVEEEEEEEEEEEKDDKQIQHELNCLAQDKAIILSQLSIKKKKSFLAHVQKAIEINFENVRQLSNDVQICKSPSLYHHLHNEIVSYLFDLSKMEEKGFLQLCKIMWIMEVKCRKNTDTSARTIYFSTLAITNNLFTDQFFYFDDNKIVACSNATFVESITQCNYSIVLPKICDEFIKKSSNNQEYLNEDDIAFLSILSMFIDETKDIPNVDKIENTSIIENHGKDIKSIIQMIGNTIYKYEFKDGCDELTYQNDLLNTYYLYYKLIGYWVKQRESFSNICKQIGITESNFYKKLQKLMILLDEIIHYSKMENNIHLKILCEESKRKIWYDDIIPSPKMYTN